MTKTDDPTRNIEELVQAATEEAGRLAQQGQTVQAEAICLKFLESLPTEPDLWKCLGAVRHHAGNVEGAIQAFENAVAQDPNDASAWASYGLLLGTAERTDDAVKALNETLRLDASQHAAAKNLGLLLMKAGRTVDASDVYRTLTQSVPEDADAWAWLGHACAASDNPEEASDAYRRALDTQPGNTNLELTLALVERDLGEIDSSTKRLTLCGKQDPGNAVIEFALAQNNLLRGEYKTGFAQYEARWRRPGMSLPTFPMPVWRGESLYGRRILLHDEQGLGDTIQFCRFAKTLEGKGAQVTLLVRPHLKRLLSTLGLRSPIVDQTPSDTFDFHSPLMSVPHHLGLTESTEFDPFSYIHAEQPLIDSWSSRLNHVFAEEPCVGLIWQGDPTSQSERGRSPALQDLAPLFELKDIHIVLLQKHHGRDAASEMAGQTHVTDLGEILDNGPDAFVDTAAVMTQLDVVITSDTGPAHLAGALGVPTWVLLKKVPEWRWSLGSDSTPWYPTMTLFRQTVRGDWSHPVSQICEALQTRKWASTA